MTINAAEEFATEASKALASIKSIYHSQDDGIIELSFVKVAPYIQGALDTLLEFCMSSSNLEPFHVQYYSRANTLVCDHTSSESNENECGLAKELYYEDETRLQCPCKMWFLEERFGK